MSVPDGYLGVWQRTLLRTAQREDTTSQVYWLQTPRWHADIRIPEGRPACAGRTALDGLTRDELLGLATQQGFAGVTEVQGDLCRWHRRADYQPPSDFNDVGRMVFETPDRCLEYGVEQDYFEIWERLPQSRGEALALELPGPNPIWLLRSGSCVMRVRARTGALPRSQNLATLAASASDETLRGWLDFELSFARIEPDRRCIVERSTLPWLEGGRLEQSEVLSAASRGMLAQGARHWHALR